MKFLVICEPDSYKNSTDDIPNFYHQLARDSRVDLHHLPTHHVFDEITKLNQVQVTAISHQNLSYEAFRQLNNQAHNLQYLTDFDLVYCRSLKPFPMGYLKQLSSWEKFTQFVNSPTHKQEQIQPDFLAKIANDWIPETLVTNDWQIALSFWQQHQVIVAKQFNSCGGRGVFKIWYEKGLFQVDNLKAGRRKFKHFHEVINHAQGTTIEPLQLVNYLSQVHQGDKRIIVVDGEIYGAFIRRSKSGYWVNNVSGDGECFLADISDLEKKAIASTVIHYQARGLHTLGYDFLLDKDGNWRISEINAGNIGGFYRLETLTGKPIMEKFIDWLIDFSQRSQIKIKPEKTFLISSVS